MDKYQVADAHSIPTPALLVFRKCVQENLRRMGELLGGYTRLRPHIKTHKMAQVAMMEMAAGVDKFKCATPKEAAMLAGLGVMDIMMSYQPVGAAIQSIVNVRCQYPQVDLSVIGDDEGALSALSQSCVSSGVEIGVLIDLNTGMDRTGALPGDPSLVLAQTIEDLDGLRFDGLHCYDGHVSNPDPEFRRKTAFDSIQKAVETRRLIESAGLVVKRLVASGSPAFEYTSQVSEVDEVSPGTWIFWDEGYGSKNPGQFEWAALVLSSVISTPASDLICLDAGNKSIAPDTPEPHFKVLGLPDNLEFVRRNEEHQVLRLPEGTPRPNVGDQFLLVPYHVCTTVNLWDEVCVIDEDGTFSETWPVDARGH
jgi:D-serine deaminase-like pyridoxal phosphate-dependent protein